MEKCQKYTNYAWAGMGQPGRLPRGQCTRNRVRLGATTTGNTIEKMRAYDRGSDGNRLGDAWLGYVHVGIDN